MGYAYEGYTYDELPDGEKLAIWEMQAQIRDSWLTDAEFHVALTTLQECKRQRHENEAMALTSVRDDIHYYVRGSYA